VEQSIPGARKFDPLPFYSLAKLDSIGPGAKDPGTPPIKVRL
jgi:hypothetical protein